MGIAANLELIMPSIQRTDPEWNRTVSLVEKIISARTITTEETIQSNGKTRVIKTTRPMRFREFSTEIGFGNPLAYRLIRGGILPSEYRRAVIEAWCKKHAKHLK